MLYPLEAEAVHERAAEEAREHVRQEGGGAHQAHLGGAAARLEDEPGDGDEREHVAELRDRARAQQRHDGQMVLRQEADSLLPHLYPSAVSGSYALVPPGRQGPFHGYATRS